MPIAYRVDLSEYEYSSELKPSEYFYSKLGKRSEIEEKFESRRPQEKPTRYDAKFVFPVLEDAKSWLSLKAKSHLFEINVEENDILHIGDWEWLQQALEIGDIENCADNYWKGNNTLKPVIEWIINKGVVKSEIQVDGKERLDLFAKRSGMPSPKEIAKDYYINK